MPFVAITCVVAVIDGPLDSPVNVPCMHKTHVSFATTSKDLTGCRLGNEFPDND